jgi:hypothetical protein
MDQNDTPAAAQPVSPAAGGDQAVAPSRFDGLDYRALQKEAANFDGVAGNLPEAELRAALIEADARRADDGDAPIPANETDEQRAAREARTDQDTRRDRARTAVGEPTAAQRDAARSDASTGTQTTISPAESIERSMAVLDQRRRNRGTR